MDVEMIREYCLHKKGCTESFPFDEVSLVFKTGNKMFAILSIDENPPSINLKCDPERAVELREKYDWVVPGFHMNKVHWNTVRAAANADTKLFFELIDHSYQLIFDSLPLKTKKEILDT